MTPSRNFMKENLNKILGKIKTLINWRRFWIWLLVLIVVLGIFFVSLIAYSYSYKDKVLPQIRIGDVPIGGMERQELKTFLENITDKLINEGFKFEYPVNGTNDSLIIYPIVILEESTIEIAYIDIEKEIERLLNFGKDGGFWSKSWNVVRARIYPQEIYLENITIDEDSLLEIISSTLDDYQTLPRDANVEIDSVSPLKYNIVSSTPGVVYDYEGLMNEVARLWSELEVVDLKINKYDVTPEVLIGDVETIENRLPSIFDDGGLQLTYTDPHTRLEYGWWISVDDIKDWLEIQKYIDENDQTSFVFGLNEEAVLKYLDSDVGTKVNVSARNAKFKMNEENGKVLEFQGSRPGISLDTEQVYQDLNQAILERTWHDEATTKSIQLTVEKVEPLVKTGDVNDLGISEVLGVGVSDYSRSPANRIGNMKNAVNKLNGLLIKPGEIFSTIEHTKPYTLEGGYLPELVIKGDEVKPEIGGGLCQIGTTLFRMAMNSAMEIVERRNHSLVVFHYDDPVNGNPGTDATVYDPAPDFKFRNDTENYILIQTYMDTASEELYFTMWGTSDGRKGSYTHPIVERWIPHGEEKIIETTKLEPGKKECQNAFAGADSSFTYTRQFANGEKENTLFESHYRPLPKICLLGVEEEVGCEEGDEECVVGENEAVSSTENVVN